jgi:hypothetical protein
MIIYIYIFFFFFFFGLNIYIDKGHLKIFSFSLPVEIVKQYFQNKE